MDSDPLKRFYELRSARTWRDLQNLHEELLNSRGNWIFRGQPAACWTLATTLDRAAERFGVRPGQTRKLEGGVLRAFKRRARQYLQNTPDDRNVLEWLALLRHHGAPSRLQDWTYSFYIGLYFALDRADGAAALWALDSSWAALQVKARLGARIHKRLLGDDRNVETWETFRVAFARRKPVPLVCPVNPYRLNSRLAAQQGLFLCPGDVAQPLHRNLAALFQRRSRNGKLIKCVIMLAADEFRRVMAELYRMNVTSTALFPDLDGFAHSLEHLLASPKILVPDSFWPKR